MAENDEQEPKMRELRCQIKNSFDDINAFLIPYPGEAVAAQNMCFYGETKNIDAKFVDCVEQLSEELFGPANLIHKKIGGQTIQAVDFLEYLKTFVDIFSGNEIPEPITILQVR